MSEEGGSTEPIQHEELLPPVTEEAVLPSREKNGVESSAGDTVAASPLSPDAAAPESPIEREVQKVDQSIQTAMNLKNEGAALFSAQNYSGAREKYIAALESLQYVGEHLTDAHKAALFELTIPLSSNAALCFFKEENYTECLTFTKNALSFIGVLEDQFSSTIKEIWPTILSRGVLTSQKLQDLKKKSLALTGKCHFFKQNFTEATTHLSKAMSLIPKADKSGKEGVELQKWLDRVTAEENKSAKREKAIWGKAFRADSGNGSQVSRPGKGSSKGTSPGKPSSRTSGFSYSMVLGAVGVAGILGISAFYLLRSRKA